MCCRMNKRGCTVVTAISRRDNSVGSSAAHLLCSTLPQDSRRSQRTLPSRCLTVLPVASQFSSFLI
eukprot:scaffold53_cov193-Pinguiococcus_pyrenoidosus.AAC.58